MAILLKQQINGSFGYRKLRTIYRQANPLKTVFFYLIRFRRDSFFRQLYFNHFKQKENKPHIETIVVKNELQDT